jgi:hypothetical protein
MDLFEKNGYVVVKKEKYKRSEEIFARKEGRASKRYGTRKPIEKIFKQEQLIAWREDI